MAGIAFLVGRESGERSAHEGAFKFFNHDRTVSDSAWVIRNE
jgi:hypothetical protein